MLLESAVKIFIKLLKYFSIESLTINPPIKNDFGAMQESGINFDNWLISNHRIKTSRPVCGYEHHQAAPRQVTTPQNVLFEILKTGPRLPPESTFMDYTDSKRSLS